MERFAPVHVSHIFKLVRDIVPISDGVKITGIFCADTNESENAFQGYARFVNGPKTDSRCRMRMDLCCCGSLGSQ